MVTRLKELRTQRGWSLQKVADYIGVNRSTIKRWEDGDNKALGMDTIVMLANLYLVSPEYILCLTDEPLQLRPQNILTAAEDLTPEEVEQVIDFISYLKNRRRK